jgi:molybdopterin converting factor small subunit
VRIDLTLFATLAQYTPPGSRQSDPVKIEVPEGSTVATVASSLGVPPGLTYVALVNGEDAEPDRPLNPGDAVVLFPPLAGGGADPVGVSAAIGLQWYTRTA